MRSMLVMKAFATQVHEEAGPGPGRAIELLREFAVDDQHAIQPSDDVPIRHRAARQAALRSLSCHRTRPSGADRPLEPVVEEGVVGA
jgi:hypothetical protein